MLYLAILSSYPNHPEASYRMGACVQKKQRLQPAYLMQLSMPIDA